MDSKLYRELSEAYFDVYAPKEILESKDEEKEEKEEEDEDEEEDTKKKSSKKYDDEEEMDEEFDVYDEVVEFLYVEGYAETLEDAEWMMANIIDEEAIDIVLGEAQAARNNPEKYEAGKKKKSAPVRGERTPMPPRGDKRREDFEKWYAKNVR